MMRTTGVNRSRWLIHDLFPPPCLVVALHHTHTDIHNPLQTPFPTTPDSTPWSSKQILQLPGLNAATLPNGKSKTQPQATSPFVPLHHLRLDLGKFEAVVQLRQHGGLDLKVDLREEQWSKTNSFNSSVRNQ